MCQLIHRYSVWEPMLEGRSNGLERSYSYEPDIADVAGDHLVFLRKVMGYAPEVVESIMVEDRKSGQEFEFSVEYEKRTKATKLNRVLNGG